VIVDSFQSLTGWENSGETMKPQVKNYQVAVGTNNFTFETGHLAKQAGGAVTLRVGDTMIFASATMSDSVRAGINFFPLTVDYEERMYAGGRIPGSFFRREGRPTEEAILTARLTDRPLRPLFPKDMRNDVQVILYSFSTDAENPIDILAVNAASAALMISNIPWNGPVGAVRIGLIEGEFVVNPTFADLEYSDLDLRIAGTRDAILMVECGASEVSEQIMVEALEYGHQAIQPLIDLQEKMAAEIGKTKSSYEPFSVEESLQQAITKRAAPVLNDIINQPYEKEKRDNAFNELRDSLIEEFAGEDESLLNSVRDAFDNALKNVVRKQILEQGIRPDGRSHTEIRSIWCEVDVSPRAHGSGLNTSYYLSYFRYTQRGPRTGQPNSFRKQTLYPPL
jgi:polyribonucleotide nucleotidyltransferase